MFIVKKLDSLLENKNKCKTTKLIKFLAQLEILMK